MPAPQNRQEYNNVTQKTARVSNAMSCRRSLRLTVGSIIMARINDRLFDASHFLMNTIALIALSVAAATYPPLVGTWNGSRTGQDEYRRWTTGGYLQLAAGYDAYKYQFEVCRRPVAAKTWSLRLDVARHPDGN
ncbi:MAG: hypothetical protein ACTHOU_21310 [Aureliella sp.]